MSIPVELIEPGGVYEGPNGQQREVVSMCGRILLYRIKKTATRGHFRPIVGNMANIRTYSFAEWAIREVE
jgi:hypothetical protein